MTRPTEDEVRPRLLWNAIEGPRAMGEYATLGGSAAFLRLAPRGDDGPVVVLPGFIGTDRSTAALRRFLRRQGHRPAAWGLGRNIGPSHTILDGVDDLVQRLADDHGRPVQLVGWSLGGIFARHVAVRRPDLVRRVVTLGSPYRLRDVRRSRAAWIYERYAGRHDAAHELEPGGPASEPLTVPTTSIFSRTDGVVPWRQCTEPTSARSENVEVYSSHNGLGHNPQAMYVVADRLALPGSTLTPFVPHPAWRPFLPSAPAARPTPRA